VIRATLSIIEIAILSVLILATRCTNYQDVFVAGNIYFTDADCYARMTRVQMCSEHPGLIIRHHDFENFPTGTTPHTTAPLDYLVLALSILLKPFTGYALDLAGAFPKTTRVVRFKYGTGSTRLHVVRQKTTADGGWD
jgi:asparagine N-glycosylation enzyme membrane subunit Stt3